MGTESKTNNAIFTSDEIEDLKCEKDTEVLGFLPETEIEVPKAEVGKSLSEFNTEIKANMKEAGISTRAVNTESARNAAITRFATALLKRHWVHVGGGKYEFEGKHVLNIDSTTLVAEIDGYSLPLQKGALKTLDQYVALSDIASISGVGQPE